MSLPIELQRWREKIEGWARDYGLDFFDTIFEMVDWEQMNMIAAYGGFPTRYPHWRFGMEYEQLSKSYSYGLSKIYELVINTDPSYAYLLNANLVVDQKLVMAHVFGHVDFFKHNFWFSKTNRKMLDEMANHGARIRRFMHDYGQENVERFLDVCLSLDNLIDPHSIFIKRHADPEEADISHDPRAAYKLKSKGYMEHFINPRDFLDEMVEMDRKKRDEIEKTRRFPVEPQKDILLFLLQHAPLAPWQQEVLAIIREEAYYFAPQGQTKVMNEGWACVAGETLVFTDTGLIPMSEVVSGSGTSVSDGQKNQVIYGQNVLRDHPTVTLWTRRGLRLTGSNNHRIWLADQDSWIRMDELKPGDSVAISGAGGLWPGGEVPTDWRPQERLTLHEAAQQSGVSVKTVWRYRKGRAVRMPTEAAQALALYEHPDNPRHRLPRTRKKITIPPSIDPRLGAFLGYLVGDGHISRAKRHLGLTTGDHEQALCFARLSKELFGLECRIKKDGGRLRVLLHSETLSDFLTKGLGLTSGVSARIKQIPDKVLQSPEAVVSAFLRAYFDCDGYAGKQGVILSTASDKLAEQVQLLLLNFGILSRRRKQTDGCWHLHVAGQSAAVFEQKVGFGLLRKQEELRHYLACRHWFKEETWTDEVMAIEKGRGDVYDISVADTHRYAAGGFINHNSYWHTTIMTQKALEPSEIIDYADHHSGTVATSPGRINPYKIGLELFRHIEERWNKGQFGREWEECDDYRIRKSWDRELGLGRQKIFEVRQTHNDITFIDEFLTADFCREHKLFLWSTNERTGEAQIQDRDFQAIKQQFLFMLTNHGQPHIMVTDANHANRGELLLTHRHEGLDLKIDYAQKTLENLHAIWKRPVFLETVLDDKPSLLSFDGSSHDLQEI